LWVVASAESYEGRRRKIKHENKCGNGFDQIKFHFLAGSVVYVFAGRVELFPVVVVYKEWIK
jgi:hypothetical protein